MRMCVLLYDSVNVSKHFYMGIKSQEEAVVPVNFCRRSASNTDLSFCRAAFSPKAK